MILEDYVDYIDAHGIPTAVPLQHDPEEFDETDSEPNYQPTPTCGQCEYFYQGKVARAKGTVWGYCPLLDAERRMSDKPCRLYKENYPF